MCSGFDFKAFWAQPARSNLHLVDIFFGIGKDSKELNVLLVQIFRVLQHISKQINYLLPDAAARGAEAEEHQHLYYLQWSYNGCSSKKAAIVQCSCCSFLSSIESLKAVQQSLATFSFSLFLSFSLEKKKLEHKQVAMISPVAADPFRTTHLVIVQHCCTVAQWHNLGLEHLSSYFTCLKFGIFNGPKLEKGYKLHTVYSGFRSR